MDAVTITRETATQPATPSLSLAFAFDSIGSGETQLSVTLSPKIISMDYLRAKDNLKAVDAKVTVSDVQIENNGEMVPAVRISFSRSAEAVIDALANNGFIKASERVELQNQLIAFTHELA